MPTARSSSRSDKISASYFIIRGNLGETSLWNRLLLPRAALPILGAERRGRQPLLVRQVRVGGVGPAEARLRRLLDGLGGDDDILAVDDGLSSDELSVGPGDLERRER